MIKNKMSEDRAYQEKEEERKGEEERKEEKRKKQVEGMGKTHMIVATLLATISFAASFTIPGGYRQESPHEGKAVLVRDAAFIAFVISNTVAVICSSSSVFLYLTASLYKLSDKEEDYVLSRYGMALRLVIIALFATTLAFVTGTYAVLGHSLGLAIPICVIGCSSLMVYALEVTRFIRTATATATATPTATPTARARARVRATMTATELETLMMTSGTREATRMLLGLD